MATEIERRTPAYIRCDPQLGAARLAALTLLDRLVVALHRAGCHPIRILCPGQAPVLKRAPALGIQVEWLSSLPEASGPTLVAECSLLVQPADVRAVIAGSGRLATADGRLLPLGITSRIESDIGESLASVSPIRACGVCGPVTDRVSAREMERKLWASLGSSTDGIVDTWFNRPLGRFLSKVLIHTPATPNQVTVASALFGLLGAWYFADGTHVAGIVGALLLQWSALVDCVDGDIARVVFKETAIGKWLDLGLDQVVHVAVFAAIAIGLSRQGNDAPVFWLGVSAVAGALISFAVVIRGRRLAIRENDARLERFLDAASTRDFTALVLLLAFIDRLEWFLWLSGIAVHLFWAVVLVQQSRFRTAPSAKSAKRRTA